MVRDDENTAVAVLEDMRADSIGEDRWCDCKHIKSRRTMFVRGRGRIGAFVMRVGRQVLAGIKAPGMEITGRFNGILYAMDWCDTMIDQYGQVAV